ncbi:MAG: outer membrane protein assembly factor BamA [Alphaproteobacteria bacterium]|nr:outer membrane protein assembly factor BamA [Alphaproteobacteria bacterium]
MKKLKYTLPIFALMAFSVQAEELEKINISGTRRIENSTVMSYLGLKKGDDVMTEDWNRASQTLFATGLFSDVKIDFEDGVAQIDVVENPIVHDVFFEGNKSLDDDILKVEVLLKSGDTFTKRKLQKDADRLLEIYKRHGRYAASIKPTYRELEQNRVDVVFEISEGEKAMVKQINFDGNQAYSDSDLKDKMMTQEKAWYRFLSSTDTYDPDRFNYDQELIRRFYLQNGYLDFEIVRSMAELMPDKEGFVLTIQLNEGEKYHVSDVDIQVQLPEYQGKTDLKDLVRLEKGDTVDVDEVNASADDITDALINDGYAFVNVTPDIIRDDENKTAKLVFRVSEGDKVFVRRINIKGNTRTKDKVIRREFRIKEGDAFNASKLRRSKQRVSDLDYFSNVDMQTIPVPENPSMVDVEMSLAEKSTGAFNIGVGWSSYDGMMFETGIQERNILGTGNIARLNLMLSQKETQYTLGLTDPYFMDYNLSAGIDLFRTTRDNSDSSSYEYETTGGTVRLGWDYTDYLRNSVYYTLRQDDITDIDSDAALAIKEQKGKTNVSLFGQDLIFDKRDSRIDPTTGYYLSLGAEIAGLGGDSKYYRVNATAIRYFSVVEDVVFSVRGDAGRVWGWGGQKVRINDRYFLGDSSLRGFEYGGVSARDIASDDALGGNWYTSASAELTFPMGLPKEMGIKGKLFTDAGYISKPDNYDPETTYYSNKIRVGVGTGILWASPMGIINLDFTYPLVKEKFDKTRVFRLNFGKGF